MNKARVHPQRSFAENSPPPPITATQQTTKNIVIFYIFVVIITVLAIGLTFSIYYWHFHKFGPHPPNFQVNSVSVSPFNVSADATARLWNISFNIQNPNKDVRIFYEEIEASVFYKQINVSSTAIPPFYQYEKDRRSLEVSVISPSILSVTNLNIANFTITIDGFVRINWDTVEGERQMLRVSCEDVNVGFSNKTTAGAMLGESKECKVHCKMDFWNYV